MFSPRPASRQQPSIDGKSTRDLPIVTATSIATEYAALSGACPQGMYVTPSADSLAIWEGVMFIHDGPYAGAVLRLTVDFPVDFPKSGPVIKFGPDVYHPMVDPKTLVWYPRNALANWQPGRHHVVHLLRALRDDFKLSALGEIEEDEARNKQLFLLYKNSNHTFLSMTAQRSRNSSASSTLFPSTAPQETQPPPSPTGSTISKSRTPVAPSTPTKKGHVRLNSGVSSVMGRNEEEKGMIKFKQLSMEEEERIRLEIQNKYGDRPS